MPSSYPSSVDTFSSKVDHVTPILAADVNAIQDAVTALENNALTTGTPQTVTGVKLFSAAPQLGNAVSLQALDTIGTPINVLTPGADNTLRLGWQTAPATNGHLIFYANGSEAARFQPSGNFTTQGGITVGAGQLVKVGTGDDLSSWHLLAAQVLDVRKGTSASPDTTAQPLAKFSRTVSLTTAQVIGAGEDYAATLFSGSSVPVGGQVQGVGVLGYADTFSTVAGADALAGAFEARALGAATAHAIATFFNARIDSSAALSAGATGSEISVDNQTGVADTLIVAGSSITKGQWIHATGNARIAVGTQYSNPFNVQMDVGIHFNSQNGGPTVSADIQTDSSAAIAYLINGSHATAAMAVKAGSGMVILGGTSSVFGNANALLELQGSDNFIDGLFVMGSTVNAKSYFLRIRNVNGQAHYGIVGVAGDDLTGTASGDSVIRSISASKALHLGGTTKVVTVTTANTLGFFATTPAAQIAGSTDVLAGLVTHGLRAASSNPPLNLGTGTLTAGTGAFSKDLKRSRQTPTEAVLVSGVDATAGEEVSVTLTAARVVGAPTNPAIGQELFFVLIQNGTGGWAVTWNAAFKVTWVDTGNTLNKRSTIAFRYDGTNWNQIGAQTAYV